jgi:hypothetical protein
MGGPCRAKAMKTNCLKTYYDQTLELNEDVADQNQGRLTGWREETGL